ncbi:MAG: hypothetical protein A3E84_00665 [Gammaproteobacteria bacterium RIFCSPHIGHO2_12_FULL_42_13]|nr:MAG: hypothetical protein A3E84_00665 [Gammaproteobacteria bacterium RIFCSPHIGHO2_12_FULL_42_13]
MQLTTQEIHVWSIDLNLEPAQLAAKEALLSADELERARQFHFPIHQKRFIAGRGVLRELLGLYLKQPPETLQFGYSPHDKPFLATLSHSGLSFNLAHSEDQALYAFTRQHAVGIDLEKIEPKKYNLQLAKRYFSKNEYEALLALPEAERLPTFFRIWSRKEAMIKAIGKGLSLPLASFSVSIQPDIERLHLENEDWMLIQLEAPIGFAAALASTLPITTISYWQLVGHKPKMHSSWTLT